MFQEKFTSNESFDRKNKYKTNDQSCPKGTVAILRQRSETESLHLDTDDHFGHHVYPSFSACFIVYIHPLLKNNNPNYLVCYETCKTRLLYVIYNILLYSLR